VLVINPSIVQAVVADYNKCLFLIILFVGHLVKHILVYLTCIFLVYLRLGMEEREIRAKNYLTALVQSSWYPWYNQVMAETLV